MDARMERFEDYVTMIAEHLGHADRVGPFRGYCAGLMLPGERKSVEPMAARVAPTEVRSAHQRLHHFVADAPWSDAAVLGAVRLFWREKQGVGAVKFARGAAISPDLANPQIRGLQGHVRAFWSDLRAFHGEANPRLAAMAPRVSSRSSGVPDGGTIPRLSSSFRRAT